MAERREYRWLRVCLPLRMIVDLFQPIGQCVAIRINHPYLPEDARVITVREDYSRRALIAIVEHESFQEVPDGQEIPLLDPAGHLAEYRVAHVVGNSIVWDLDAKLPVEELACGQANAYAALRRMLPESD